LITALFFFAADFIFAALLRYAIVFAIFLHFRHYFQLFAASVFALLHTGPR
jgi:hypothetical protein